MSEQLRWVVGQNEDCDVRVDDPYVSGQHCLVVRVDDQYTVTDLGSTNGTRIRRADDTVVQVRGHTPIYPGDTLIVGRSEMPWLRMALPWRWPLRDVRAETIEEVG